LDANAREGVAIAGWATGGRAQITTPLKLLYSWLLAASLPDPTVVVDLETGADLPLRRRPRCKAVQAQPVGTARASHTRASLSGLTLPTKCPSRDFSTVCT
jgi:hypothetical protein